MKLQTSNLAAESRVRNTKQRNEKLGQKGRGLGHVTYFWILGPPIISGSDEATNGKFCSWIERKEYYKYEKLGQKGAWLKSRGILLNFGTPLLSTVRIKLQTSNLTARSRVSNTKQK